jgi:hypothetical protein
MIIGAHRVDQIVGDLLRRLVQPCDRLGDHLELRRR